MDVDVDMDISGDPQQDNKCTNCHIVQCGCFAIETMACRILNRHSNAERVAYEQCFGVSNSTRAIAQLVTMQDLAAGDEVLSHDVENDRLAVDRVIVNMHRERSTRAALLLTLSHSSGSLTVTPDHLVWADGQLVAARHVRAGSTVVSGDGRDLVVHDVKPSVGAFVNPLLSKNLILAAGGVGDTPIRASTHSDWYASSMDYVRLAPFTGFRRRPPRSCNRATSRF